MRSQAARPVRGGWPVKGLRTDSQETRGAVVGKSKVQRHPLASKTTTHVVTPQIDAHGTKAILLGLARITKEHTDSQRPPKAKQGPGKIGAWRTTDKAANPV